MTESNREDARTPRLKSGGLPSAGWLNSKHWLSVFALVLAGRSFISFQWPFAPTSPRALDLALAITMVLFAGFIELVNPFRSEMFLFAMMLVPLAVLTIMTATRVTLQGLALLSSAWTFLAVIGALYLSRNWLMTLLVGQTIAYAIAAWMNSQSGVDVIASVTSGTAVLLSVIVFTLVQGQQRLSMQLEHLAIKDPLTGVLNRRGAEMEADAVRSVADRSAAPTAVVLIDLDNFKGLNDRHGHEAGDKALVDITKQWQSRLRTGDVLGRIGGDEFMLVLPDADEDTAVSLLKRLRENNPVQWCFGLATWQPGQSLNQALRRADADLYSAKADLKRNPQQDQSPETSRANV